MKTLPVVLAELVDNSLSATNENHSVNKKRQIGIRFYHDSVDQSKSVLVITDNGCGMSTEDLTNWARFKYSKFHREELQMDGPSLQKKIKRSETSSTSSLEKLHTVAKVCPQAFLNSNLSSSGAGGLQAAFFLGNRVRIISRSRNSADVKEIELSREGEEATTHAEVISRKVGSTENATEDSTFGLVIRKHLEKEAEYGNSFTSVFITDMGNEHGQLDDLKDPKSEWQAQLAHIYHYYLHGPLGNLEEKALKKKSTAPSSLTIEMDFKGFKISSASRARKQVTLFHQINLCDIDSDSQTVYIRKSQAQFEFKGKDVNGSGKLVAGVVRYYPFQISGETYPGEVYGKSDDEVESLPNEGRGSRAIFESYWNGRLIPNSPVQTLNWTKFDKSSSKAAKEECFNRLAGVIWFNNEFHVTQNKMSFQTPPEVILNNDKTFASVAGVPHDFVWSYKQNKNNFWTDLDIHKAFRDWLVECHNSLDKVIQFREFVQVVTKPDEVKKKQHPWSYFKKITWDGKDYNVGDVAQTINKKPNVAGTITGFLLFGDYSNNTNHEPIYGADGFFKVIRHENTSLAEEQFIPLFNLDRQSNEFDVEYSQHNNNERLPAELKVEFVSTNGTEKGKEFHMLSATFSERKHIPPCHLIGAFQVDVLNKFGKSVKGVIPGSKKKITVKLILLHGTHMKNSFESSDFSSEYGYKFNQIGDMMTELGNWTIRIEAWIKTPESSAQMELPVWEQHYVVIPGEVHKMSIDEIDGEYSRVGEPFSISISFKDRFNHKTSPPEKYDAIITSKDFKFSHSLPVLRGSKLVIEKVVGKGEIGDQKVKDVKFEVLVRKKRPFLKPCEVHRRFRAGKPSTLAIFPEDDEEIRIDNGTLPQFGARVFDLYGNQLVRNLKSLTVICKFYIEREDGLLKDLPGHYLLDLVNGPDGKLVNLKGDQVIRLDLNPGETQIVQARLSLKNFPKVDFVSREITVIFPSQSPVTSEMDKQLAAIEMQALLQKQELVEKTRADAERKKVKLLAAIQERELATTLVETQVNNFMGHWRASDPQIFNELGLTPQTTAEQVTALIAQQRDQLRELQLLDAQRREDHQANKIEPAPNEPGVLGKVCHLAVVDNPTDAFIISWHLQGVMDMIITHTSDKLLELCKLFLNFKPPQQLLAIESIYKDNLDWNRRMPHENQSHISVSGNPIYARKLLKFPRNEELCRVVFENLIGPLIIIDTLEDAHNYRNQIVKFAPCPTIITRDGNRLRHNGRVSCGKDNILLGSKLKKGIFELTPDPRIEKLTSVISNLAIHHENLLKLRADPELRSTQQVELDKVNAEIEKCRIAISKIHSELSELSRNHYT